MTILDLDAMIRTDVQAEIDAELERRVRGEELRDEADRLSGDLRAFVYACWHLVVPTPLTRTWHVDAVCDHLQAAYDRELPRLLVTIPPGSLKSTLVSVIAPAWQWTRRIEERIISASYRDRLAERDTTASRRLMQTAWFRARWPDVLLSADENLKSRYSNTHGGYRVASHVGGGTGERGSVLLLDDPHNAQEIQSDVMLQNARDWYGNTWSSRINANVDDPGVKIVIGQRIGQGDLIGFILAGEDGESWTHLCLPARYETKHPYRYPRKVKLPSGRQLHGDPRKKDGELLAPTYMDERALRDVTASMSQATIAGQYQQRPAPREGAIIKRRHWRYYPREVAEQIEDGDVSGLPAFQVIVCSWDTAVKDSQKADYVAGTCWGAAGADRYLLRTFHERASLGRTKTAIKEMRQWALDRWPALPIYSLVENAANGPEVVAQLERELTGVIATRPSVAADQPSVKKTVRAEACEPEFEAGQVKVPGAMSDTLDGYDPVLTPAWAQEVIEECAVLPNGTNDDLVDSTTQALNYIRTKSVGTLSTSKPGPRRAAPPTSLASTRGRRVRR